jgi:hypothetical protein
MKRMPVSNSIFVSSDTVFSFVCRFLRRNLSKLLFPLQPPSRRSSHREVLTKLPKHQQLRRQAPDKLEPADLRPGHAVVALKNLPNLPPKVVINLVNVYEPGGS